MSVNDKRYLHLCVLTSLTLVVASVGFGCGSTEPPTDPSPTETLPTDKAPAEAPPAEAPDSDTTSTRIPRRGDTPDAQGEEETSRSAPWERDLLQSDDVPPVYLEQWMQAENRHSCAPLAPIDLAEGEGADVRSAYFGGGWGVAYDLPGLRSAFGIAGTGAEAASPSYDEWPFHVEWKDGSSAGYGPEGGSGPNQLAYLRIQGQGCLYNVWSRLGVRHLRYLLENLRYVETGG